MPEEVSHAQREERGREDASAALPGLPTACMEQRGWWGRREMSACFLKWITQCIGSVLSYLPYPEASI